MVATAEKASLLGSQFNLTASSVVRNTSLLSLSLSLGEIRGPSKPLSSCVCFLILIRMGVLIFWVFNLFLEKVADIIAAKLSMIFPGLIRLGSFPECWRSANVTAFPKGAPSPDRENYGPISITSILSKVHEKFVSHKLSSFCQKYVLPAALFAYRKGLDCTNALLIISHHLQKSLNVGMESYIVQFDISAAFDIVSHSGLLFKL